MSDRSPAHRDDLPSLSALGLELVAASFLVLFQELTLIRWLPSQVRVIAYFPNLILIAAFLGLGIGALRAGGRSLLWLWPVSLLAVVGAGCGLSGIAFTGRSVSEHLWLLYADLPPDAPVIDAVQLPIVALFVSSALTFVGPGQFVAVRLNTFRYRTSALRGYALDLVGSLLGVIGFALASFAGAFPDAWFAVIAVIGAALFLRRPRLLPLHAVLATVAVLAVHRFEKGELYSPYYSLSSVPVTGTSDHLIRANGSLHQVAVALRRSDPTLTIDRAETLAGYHLPYRVLKRRPGRVLVLGAGTGNDVAVALDEGADVVHAVEIDPGILEYGRELHPNRPYQDARVTVMNTDARSFLNDTDETYDLIVFGTLDSMTRLSALSNVRLDNFVYTRDALEAAAARLRPGGGIALYFMVGQDHIDTHLLAMLMQTFGAKPVLARSDWNLFNSIYMAGPAFAHAAPPTTAAEQALIADVQHLNVPTDDWPYLYLPDRGVSAFYLTLMLAFIVIAVIAVAWASPELRSGLRKARGIDLEMFLFGVAFLLLETRFVTVMNLAWGATWLTSAVVFGSIIAVILVSTLWMDLRPVSWRSASAGLLVALACSWLLPSEILLAREGTVRLVLSALYVALPVFFAAACFALRFQTRASPNVAFGWNLLGAVAGGLIEFTSMAVGLRALTLVVILAYLIAFRLAKTSGAPPTARSGWPRWRSKSWRGGEARVPTT
jgi:SAM-dependent methyltransferase